MAPRGLSADLWQLQHPAARGLVVISCMWTAVHRLFAEHEPTQILWGIRASKPAMRTTTKHPCHLKPDWLKTAENHPASVTEGTIKVLHTLFHWSKHQTQVVRVSQWVLHCVIPLQSVPIWSCLCPPTPTTPQAMSCGFCILPVAAIAKSPTKINSFFS